MEYPHGLKEALQSLSNPVGDTTTVSTISTVGCLTATVLPLPKRFLGKKKARHRSVSSLF